MTPKELTAAAARAERLRDRNLAQRQQLRAAAAGMADHASTFTDGIRERAAAGDPEAIAQYRRALVARARARRCAE